MASGHNFSIVMSPLRFLVFVGLAALAATEERFAYVAMHYEGTPADTEYILALRILIHSLKGTKHDIVVLVSDSVSAKSRNLFMEEGAIIRQVDDVPNPFSHVLARFKNTFNKLHLWNMTDYTRVIYLDSDNIVLHLPTLENSVSSACDD